MTKSDTPAATPSADVQAVREALTEARLWFGPLTPMRVNRAVDAAIPALDAIEKEMGMLRNDGDNAWTRYLQEKSRAVIAEARLAQMTETYNERGDRLLDASARLAKEEAALRELRDELNTRAKKFGGTEESMRASLVPIIDAALSPASPPVDDAQVGGGRPDIVVIPAQGSFERDEYIDTRHLPTHERDHYLRTGELPGEITIRREATPAPEREEAGIDAAVDVLCAHARFDWLGKADDLFALVRAAIDAYRAATPTAPDRAVPENEGWTGRKCPHCNGTGLISDDSGGSCPHCGGTGDEYGPLGLRALLKECSDELAEWVEHHYAATKDHPSEARRYERDMEPVRRARAALQGDVAAGEAP
jgi:hypothetical protein